MIKNVVKTALRHLYKRKAFSIINILGLSVGLTCCILILLWVNDEISYDRFHDNYKNIYRVGEMQKQGEEDFPVGVTPAPLGPALVKEFPEIISSVRLQHSVSGLIKHEDKVFNEHKILLAENNFFEMFSFKLLKGDNKQILKDPYSFVITEHISKKYFGESDPIGKTLTFNNALELTVTGVCENPPKNSHIKFSMIAPFKILANFGYDLESTWGSNSYITYVQLQENSSYIAVNDKIKDFLSDHDPGYYVKLHLQPLKHIHLRSNYTADWSGHGSNMYVMIFSIIAAFIMLIACINFMNLSTAQAPLRAREIGIRKVMGANRKLLVLQFLGESLLVSILALCIAIGLVELLLPYYNDFTGKAISLDSSNNQRTYFWILGITLINGLLAGSYPALVMSSFNPVKVLKGKTSSRKGVVSRQILVIFQFTLSIALIACTLIIMNQVELINKIDLGYEKDQIIRLSQNSSITAHFEVFQEELLKNPRIESLTSASSRPTDIYSSGYGLRWEGMTPDEERSHLVHTLAVGPDFFKTFDIKIREGRAFSLASDTLNSICNSAVIDIIGSENPLGLGIGYYSKELGELVGIIEDFHFKSIHSEIEPLIISYSDKHIFNQVFLRVSPVEIESTVEYIETVWKKYSDNYPFDYYFLDEVYDKLYNSEYRMSKLFNFFSILAILISCLGLYGLVSFTANSRIKEIGIRKVLGASVKNILFLLSSRFLLLVIISNIIAGFLSWYYMDKWLHNFAYKIDITLLHFISAGAAALVIAIITLSFQVIKAAMANPVDSLHYE